MAGRHRSGRFGTRCPRWRETAPRPELSNCSARWTWQSCVEPWLYRSSDSQGSCASINQRLRKSRDVPICCSVRSVRWFAPGVPT
jgi:hypothetical protein